MTPLRLSSLRNRLAIVLSSVVIALLVVVLYPREHHFSNLHTNALEETEIWREFVNGTDYSLLPPDEVTDDNRSLGTPGEIPNYVIDHCPLMHLYSDEIYWPSDFSEYVTHFRLRHADGSDILDKVSSIKDLHEYYNVTLSNGTNNIFHTEDVYMTSFDDFDKDPKWMMGYKPKYGTGQIQNAPALVFVVDKGNGWVDAFWFYFYPFNWGPFIMGYGPWGNHLGDWEHTLVRFYNGEPKYLWMSAHGGGSAYNYEAIEKKKRLRRIDGHLTNDVIERPLLFSARGTHANYPSVGQHAHDVPFFFMPLSDFTDRGPLWDPALNYYGYTITKGNEITPATERTKTELGVEWLHFQGHWGDKQIPFSDPRQKFCIVQWKYIDGPRGPLRKNLDRVSLCQRFKWWNFWGACPVRRRIKNGVGLDAEKNDLVGDNCGILLYKIRPKWLRSIIGLITWRGFLCFLMDNFTG